MKWFRELFKTSPKESDEALDILRNRFDNFLALLENNNQVLKVTSDMEEKSQGEHLFDINYIRSGLAQIQAGVEEIIERMIALGGEEYAPLRERYASIAAEAEDLLEGRRPIPKDAFTIPFAELSSDRAFSVGSKSAQLGEMAGGLGLPVPEGFAISAWAYKHFVDSNDLQARISDKIKTLDIKQHADLVRASQDIQAMVVSSPVPEDLAAEIRRSYADLRARSSTGRFSLRSSAIGEDTLFSFAGQYSSFLNVREDELVDCYRAVLASKFTPQAIYYFLSHDLTESELAMSVSCVAMVDAAASGVIYTRDPVRPDDDSLLVSSIYGLGKYLVDGTLTPDLFRVSRSDGSLIESKPAQKTVRLVMRPEGGTIEEKVPESDQPLPSLGESHLKSMADFAVKIEAHYGAPQDIEWALDHSNRLFLLQTRPLKIVKPRSSAVMPDTSGYRILISGGTTVCPGAGDGPVCHLTSTKDLEKVPDGAVLVAPHPFPGLITVMDRAHALVTEVGGVASHMATLARENQIPTLAGVNEASALPPGQIVTVDATGAVIYQDSHPDLIAARRPEYELFDDSAILNLLERVLGKVTPLNLLHPSDPDFTIGNCRTFHDLTRFAHQKAMEEMFTEAKGIENKERFGLRLKSNIPLDVSIIFIDESFARLRGKRRIEEEEIASAPMKSFWNGVKKEGWVSELPTSTGGLLSVLTTHLTSREQSDFSESSFAILSKEYMVLSLRLGYHFTTIEAMCTSEPSKNYIRMQHKGGGASLDRRIRRVQLIMDLLSELGFEHSGKGDFLDSAVSYMDDLTTLSTLELLGRITMITKQLDMALSNEAITRWYTEDFAKKLGLGKREARGE